MGFSSVCSTFKLSKTCTKKKLQRLELNIEKWQGPAHSVLSAPHVVNLELYKIKITRKQNKNYKTEAYLHLDEKKRKLVTY